MGLVLPLRLPRRTGTIHLCDESLSASNIHANYLAKVDLANSPENGDLAAVVVNGELLVRYFWRTENGCIHLAPANPDYPVKCVQANRVFIIGRILETYAVKASTAGL